MLEAQQIRGAVLRVAGVKWALRTPETGCEFCFGAASRTYGPRTAPAPVAGQMAPGAYHVPGLGYLLGAQQ